MSLRNLAYLSVVLVIIGPVMASEASGSYVLRPIVIVPGPVVYLGDIFSGLDEEKSRKEVGLAPPLGKTFIWHSSTLQSIAKRFEVSIPIHAFSKIQIQRSGYVIPHDWLSESLDEKIRPYIKDIAIFKTRIETPLYAPFPVNQMTPIDIQQFNFSHRNKSFSGLLTFPQTPDFIAPFKGKVIPLKTVPTLKNSLAKGVIICEKDVTFQTVEDSFSLRDVVQDKAALLGSRVIVNRIKAGEPIRDQDILLPHTITPNQKVLLVFRVKNLELTLEGKALQKGRLGEIIRVLNPRNKEIVTGTVARGYILVSGPNIP